MFRGALVALVWGVVLSNLLVQQVISLEWVNVDKADSFVQQAQLGEKHIALKINLELVQEATIEVRDTVIIEGLSPSSQGPISCSLTVSTDLAGPLFSVVDQGVLILRNLTICSSGGTLSSPLIQVNKNGVLVLGSSTVAGSNSTSKMNGCIAGQGGATILGQDSFLQDCRSEHYGGALSLQDGSQALLVNTLFNASQAPIGGALAIDSDSFIFMLDGSDITRSQAEVAQAADVFMGTFWEEVGNHVEWLQEEQGGEQQDGGRRLLDVGGEERHVGAARGRTGPRTLLQDQGGSDSSDGEQSGASGAVYFNQPDDENNAKTNWSVMGGELSLDGMSSERSVLRGNLGSYLNLSGEAAESGLSVTNIVIIVAACVAVPLLCILGWSLRKCSGRCQARASNKKHDTMSLNSGKDAASTILTSNPHFSVKPPQSRANANTRQSIRSVDSATEVIMESLEVKATALSIQPLVDQQASLSSMVHPLSIESQSSDDSFNVSKQMALQIASKHNTDINTSMKSISSALNGGAGDGAHHVDIHMYSDTQHGDQTGGVRSKDKGDELQSEVFSVSHNAMGAMIGPKRGGQGGARRSSGQARRTSIGTTESSSGSNNAGQRANGEKGSSRVVPTIGSLYDMKEQQAAGYQIVDNRQSISTTASQQQQQQQQQQQTFEEKHRRQQQLLEELKQQTQEAARPQHQSNLDSKQQLVQQQQSTQSQNSQLINSSQAKLNTCPSHHSSSSSYSSSQSDKDHAPLRGPSPDIQMPPQDPLFDALCDAEVARITGAKLDDEVANVLRQVTYDEAKLAQYQLNEDSKYAKVRAQAHRRAQQSTSGVVGVKGQGLAYFSQQMPGTGQITQLPLTGSMPLSYTTAAQAQQRKAGNNPLFDDAGAQFGQGQGLVELGEGLDSDMTATSQQMFARKSTGRSRREQVVSYINPLGSLDSATL